MIDLRLRRLFFAAVVASIAGGSACVTARNDADADASREAPKEPWRATRPAAGPPLELKLPDFQKAELKNGLTVIVIEDHGLPTVRASLVVKAGSSVDGKEAGLASLTWDLLDEGAGTMNAPGVANAFADIGSAVSVGAGREYGTISAGFLKKNADRGLELIGLIAQKPAFAAADFDRVKKLAVDALKAKDGDPEAVLADVIAGEVFGRDHAYGHTVDGNLATVDKIKPSSVKRFWSDYAAPKSAALVLAGDLTLDEAKALAEKHFGKWRGGGKAQKPPTPPKAKTVTKIFVVDFPGAPQTMVRVARPLLAVNDPDEAAIIVMNQVLGGMFSSRLNLKLREDKQWTYGAFSWVDPRSGVGPFVVGADVQTPNTGDAVKEIFDQFDTLKTGGVTEEELALGKANFVKSIPGLYALPAATEGAAAELFALGQPFDHHAKLVAAVSTVTGEQAKKAAERAIVKEDFVVVLVGDREAIEAGLKDKNLGEIVFLNKDGSVAPAPAAPAAPAAATPAPTPAAAPK